MSINNKKNTRRTTDIFDDDFEVIYEGELPDISIDDDDDDYRDVLSGLSDSDHTDYIRKNDYDKLTAKLNARKNSKKYDHYYNDDDYDDDDDDDDYYDNRRNRRNKKKKDDSTIVFFNSYLFKFNFCKAPFEQDERLYCGKREKQYGSCY